MTPRIGSLCSGYCGLDLGVAQVCGGTTVWVSDIDKGANKILAHRYPDVPNLGDFTALDWSTVAPVDILTAGFPCQPVSNAGKQLGDEDERWLWDDVARAVRDLRPGLVVLENVRGLLSAGGGRLFGRVLGALADLGYDARWHGLRAADIGAPHGRFRVFVVATDAHSSGRGEHGRSLAVRQERAAAQRAGDPALTLLPTPAVKSGADLDAIAKVDQWGDYAPAIARWEHVLGRPAPAPTMTSAKGKPQLSPAFVEWMMGLPAGWVTDVPGITRNEALKALGNGVVPQQAAAALRTMLAWEAVA